MDTPSNLPAPPAELPPQPPAPAAPAAPPPPAAKIVVEGTRTERELTLERDLRERETRINSLEDENRRLKVLGQPTQPQPAPEKKSWLSGLTFFDEE